MKPGSSEKIALPTDPLLRKAHQLAEYAREAGGRALLVGGYVRDALLGLDPKDADVEVYGIEAGALRRLLGRLGRVSCVGESFRVYKLVWHSGGIRYELDVSLPRRDRKVGAGHRGFEVEGDPHATFEEAARRRDFTINAILCDPHHGEIVDPFNGRVDLEKRILRAVDAGHFAEDSLRVLRAAQFAARFEMEIEPATAELCRGIALDDLPRERIWGEWEKLLLKARRPSVGLRAARELHVLSKQMPFLEEAMARQGEKLCGAVDGADKEGLPEEKQVALLLAVLGVFIGEKGEAEPLLDAFGLKTMNGYDVRAQSSALVAEAAVPEEWYQLFKNGDTPPDGAFRRIAARCEPLLLARLCAALGHQAAAEWFIGTMRELGVENGPPPPFLMGRHLLELGLQPGRRVGEIARVVYEKQLDGTVTSLEGALITARQLLEKDS